MFIIWIQFCQVHPECGISYKCHITTQCGAGESEAMMHSCARNINFYSVANYVYDNLIRWLNISSDSHSVHNAPYHCEQLL